MKIKNEKRIFWGFHTLYRLVKDKCLSDNVVFIHDDVFFIDNLLNEILSERKEKMTKKDMKCTFYTYDQLYERNKKGDIFIDKNIYFVKKSIDDHVILIKRESSLNRVHLVFDKRFLFFDKNLPSEFTRALFFMNLLEESGFLYESEKFFLDYDIFSKYLTEYTSYTDSIIFPSVPIKYKTMTKNGINDKIKEYTDKFKKEKILFLLPIGINSKEKGDNFKFLDAISYRDYLMKKNSFDSFEKIIVLDSLSVSTNPQFLHLLRHNTLSIDIISINEDSEKIGHVIKTNQNTFEKYMMLSIPSHNRGEHVYSFAYEKKVASLYTEDINLINLKKKNIPFNESKYIIEDKYKKMLLEKMNESKKNENLNLNTDPKENERFSKLYKSVTKHGKRDELKYLKNLLSEKIVSEVEMGYLFWLYLNNENKLYDNLEKKINDTIELMPDRENDESLLFKTENFNIKDIVRKWCLKYFLAKFLASVKNTKSFSLLKGSSSLFTEIKKKLSLPGVELIEKNREWVKNTILDLKLMRSIFTELTLDMKDHNRKESEKKYGSEKIKQFIELTKKVVDFINNFKYVNNTTTGYHEILNNENNIGKLCTIKKIGRNTKIGVLKKESNKSITLETKDDKDVKVLKKDLEIFEPLNTTHSFFDRKFKDNKNIIKINVDGITSQKFSEMYGFNLNDYGLSKYEGWVYAINGEDGKLKYIGYFISTVFQSKKNLKKSDNIKKNKQIEIEMNTSASEKYIQPNESGSLIVNDRIIPSLRDFRWPEGYELLLRMYIDCWKNDSKRGENKNYKILKFCLTNLSRINEVEASLVTLLSEFRSLNYIDDTLKERVYIGIGYLFKSIFKFIDSMFKISFEKGVDFSLLFSENNRYMLEKFFDKQ